MSMYSPLVSSTSSHARGPRPLSITCVRPPSRFSSRNSEAGIQLLQLVLGGRLDVVVERVAVGVDPDGERPEVLNAEAPEALGHQLLPGNLLDLLDLRRLERGRAADDREIDHPEPLHRLDRLVREAPLPQIARTPYCSPSGSVKRTIRALVVVPMQTGSYLPLSSLRTPGAVCRRNAP